MSYFVHEQRSIQWDNDWGGLPYLVYDRFRLLPQNQEWEVMGIASTKAQADTWPIRTIGRYTFPYWRSARGQIRWHEAWAPVVAV